MSVLKTQGMQLAIGTAFGTTFTISAITNANPAVATHSAAHGVVVNDIIQVFSGWKRLNERVLRASVVATNDVTYEGLNTVATADYPAGEGIGTGREITTWTPITQLLPDFSVSGGGFREVEITEMDDVRVKNLITLAEPVDFSFTGHFDSALPWISAITTAARAGVAYPYRITLSGGGKFYGAANIGFNPEPQPRDGVFTYSLALKTVADTTVYAS